MEILAVMLPQALYDAHGAMIRDDIDSIAYLRLRTFLLRKSNFPSSVMAGSAGWQW